MFENLKKCLDEEDSKETDIRLRYDTKDNRHVNPKSLMPRGCGFFVKKALQVLA